jgi:hypothetical protein
LLWDALLSVVVLALDVLVAMRGIEILQIHAFR